MPREPNYQFERNQRTRAKAAKLAEKAAVKAELRRAERAQLDAASTEQP